MTTPDVIVVAFSATAFLWMFQTDKARRLMNAAGEDMYSCVSGTSDLLYSMLQHELVILGPGYGGDDQDQVTVAAELTQ